MASCHFVNQTMSCACPQLPVLLLGCLSPQHCLSIGYQLIWALGACPGDARLLDAQGHTQVSDP